MTALIVKEPWATMIVTGKKTIELRTRRTTKIGEEIYIAKAGTKTLIGKVTIQKCSSLTKDEYHLLKDKHKAAGIYANRQIYGWFLSNPVQFQQPIPYRHPQGAQMWVKLGHHILCNSKDTITHNIAPTNS